MNWIQVPLGEEIIDTVISRNDSIQINIHSQSRDYISFFLDNKEHLFFQSPGSQQTITWDNQGQVHFEGPFLTINEFLLSRSPHADFRPRAAWQHGKGDLKELVRANDSITREQQEQVMAQSSLPQWYKDFEVQRLEYLNVERKLTSIAYRNKLLQLNDTIPEGLFQRFSEGLILQNREFLGLVSYMRFLGDLIAQDRDPQFREPIPSSKSEWLNYTTRTKAGIDSFLTDPLIHDVYLAHYLTKMIKGKRHVLKEEWFDDFYDPKYKRLVKEQLEAQPLLANGVKVPYFKLIDPDSVLFSPADFSGKIVLINFWATWCQPCIKEFKHENNLVKSFASEPVEIVNICIESDHERWLEYIDRYGLRTKNLFANENWSQTINENFGTVSLPHSVLIGQDGQVIQNKCATASSGAEDLINEALSELRNEKDS